MEILDDGRGEEKNALMNDVLHRFDRCTKKRKHSQIDRRRTNEVLSGEREKRTKKSLREWLFSSERFVRSL